MFIISISVLYSHVNFVHLYLVLQRLLANDEEKMKCVMQEIRFLVSFLNTLLC